MREKLRRTDGLPRRKSPLSNAHSPIHSEATDGRTLLHHYSLTPPSACLTRRSTRLLLLSHPRLIGPPRQLWTNHSHFTCMLRVNATSRCTPTRLQGYALARILFTAPKPPFRCELGQSHAFFCVKGRPATALSPRPIPYGPAFEQTLSLPSALSPLFDGAHGGARPCKQQASGP